MLPAARSDVQPVAARSHVQSITPGVFFTLPEPLPRGRHKLTRAQVRAAQHERLLAAVTELLAARGYRGFGPADIASRAGVSLAAFYACFPNRDACVFAGYDRFITVLLGRMTALDLTAADRPGRVQLMLHAYLDTLSSDLVVARAYQVEIDALGVPARERRRDSLKLFADRLRELDAHPPDGHAPYPELPRSAYIGVVYAARQLSSDALDQTITPDLLALGTDIERWLSDLFRER
jgi:AcrR family transcriptional regulator